jgi:hypothetical protein
MEAVINDMEELGGDEKWVIFSKDYTEDHPLDF